MLVFAMVAHEYAHAVTALEKVEGVSKANVKLVMSPPWSPDRMTDEARLVLNMW